MNRPAAAPSVPHSYQEFAALLSVMPPPAAMVNTALAADLQWLTKWQGEHSANGRRGIRMAHPRLAIFAANHGVAYLEPKQTGHIATQEQFALMSNSNGVLGQQIAALDADLRLYDMNLAHATNDFMAAPAMSEADCINAMVYGMMAVEAGLDILALTAYGDGQCVAAATLLAALSIQPLPATLSACALPAHLATQLVPIVANYNSLSPWQMLAAFGSPALAAMVGAMLAARMGRIPLIISEWGGLAAAAILYRLQPEAVSHIGLAGDMRHYSAWLVNSMHELAYDEATANEASLTAVAAMQSLQQQLELSTKQA